MLSSPSLSRPHRGFTTRHEALTEPPQTYTCRNNAAITTQRAPLYDIGPLLLKTDNQTREKRSLVLSAFLTGQPPSDHSADDYIGFHSPISYTSTTPTSTGDETPRTVQLPSFTLYRSSPACPSEPNKERQGTFVRVGDFHSPNSPKDDIDWREYQVIEGKSPSTRNSGSPETVLRTDTRGGAQKKDVRCLLLLSSPLLDLPKDDIALPPRTQCIYEGQTEVEPFVAIYWFLR